MLSDSLRSRLAELNREPLPAVKPSAVAPSPEYESPCPAVTPSPCYVSSGREVETPLGKHWLIERPIASMWNQADALVAQFQTRLLNDNYIPQQHADWQYFARHFPQQAAFLDLETCGFSGSMAFLVGVIHDSPDGLVLSQILARNYAEEAAMLFTLWQIMQSRGMLLTFNGKSFDWPMVIDRSTLHRLDAAGHTRALDHHIDLLHHGRRRYRRELPNCKLQTLERHLCGRRRAADIPGSEIPEAYHHYVRTGDNAEMKSILHHNALDLLTLLQLSLRFAVE